jgi:hypothetical protein
MSNHVPTAAEGMSKIKRRSPNAPRPEDNLSFFRRATRAEVEAGAMPLIFWSVQPSGNYLQDVERGHAIAEEMLAFLVAAPTNGNLTMLSSMLNDMQRFADMSHRGLFVGFGSVVAKFALIGATIVGPDAVRMDKERDRAAA